MAFFSGGKNSAAMVHRLNVLGKTPDVTLFCDTGLEFPETYEFIEEFETRLGIEITIEKNSKHSFEDWFYKPYSRGNKEGQIHGFPMTHNPCYWARESKVKIMNKYNKKYETKYVGFASDETNRNMNDATIDYPLQKWGWNEIYCRKYCEKHNILNPLYNIFPRLGCWLCPYQPKKSVRALYKYLMDNNPGQWEYLMKLEAESPHGFKPNFRLESVMNHDIENDY